MLIRKLREGDINRVAEIWLDTNINAHNFISSRYWRDNFKAVKEMLPQAEVYVYEEGHKIHAFIGLREDYIEGIFVWNTVQSNGIGKQLLDFAKGIRKQLRLKVYQKNTKAVKFYQREHFSIQCENVDENTGEMEYSMIWIQS